MNSITLQGHRSILRKWRQNDEEAVVKHANNVNIAKHLRDRFPHPYTLANARAFLEMASAEDPQTNFAIEIDGEAAGGLGYVPGGDVERYSVEVGYWLGEAHWGRGIVTEALTIFTDYAFSRLGLLRVFALPLADNPASLRVLEKAGYSVEGRLRSSCVKYGQVRDQLLYARVNPNWKA